MKVLLTGANGFLGKGILSSLSKEHQVSIVSRKHIHSECDVDKNLAVGDFNGTTDFSTATSGQDCVLHVAGKAHSSKVANETYDEFKSVNVDATLNLASQAASDGVGRFIFISSIGVHGSSSSHPFKHNDVPFPQGHYAKTKLEAELGLKSIGEESGMEIVIIRPPLIYGANAPGNFSILRRAVESGIPLPLGAIENERSFVALENLIDLLQVCIEHPNAANQTFLVSDDEIISTTDFIKCMIEATGRNTRLVPVPASVLAGIASLIGKTEQLKKLTDSVSVDIEHTKSTLNWQPPLNSRQAMLNCFK